MIVTGIGINVCKEEKMVINSGVFGLLF